MISESEPEPLCDVAAQLSALRDPLHPKDAVWLARGTGIPSGVDGLIVISNPAGLLVTTNIGKALYFNVDPTDDGLAMILDYVEPKWRIVGVPAVVQARNPKGAVVLEMAVSGSHASAAIERASKYGSVELMGLPAALMRRAMLFGMEGHA